MDQLLKSRGGSNSSAAEAKRFLKHWTKSSKKESRLVAFVNLDSMPLCEVGKLIIVESGAAERIRCNPC